MNDLNRENADKILRTLYHLKANTIEAYLNICDANLIPEYERDMIYRYLDSRGFLKNMGKVGNGDVYVALSKDGFKFFSEDNLVSEYARKHTQQIHGNSNTYNIAGDASNFGNTNKGPVENTSSHTQSNESNRESFFYKLMHDTFTQTVSGLIVAAIIAFLTWFFTYKH